MTATADQYRYDPLAADVHADPYPYYAMLRRDTPFSTWTTSTCGWSAGTTTCVV
jgi:hypothetical protein